MLRKISALVLVLALITVCLPGQAIIDVKAATEEENKHSAIIEQILSLDETISASKNELQVISLSKSETARGQLSSSKDSELAVRMVEQDGDTFEVTTIYPYIVTEDGDLVSSFEYTPKNTRAYPVFEYEFVDTIVAVTVRFDMHVHINLMPTFYRHLGVKARWTSNNDSVSVSTLYVEYQSYGDLYKYPDCLTSAQYENMIQRDYLIYSIISKGKPTKGTTYSSAEDPMPQNRLLDIVYAADHGGWLYVDVDYTVNGTKKNYWSQDNPYVGTQ